MPNLIHLDFQDNNITEISSISNLKKLASLDTTRNKITDFSPIKNLSNLRELTIHSNKISDISDLSKLTELEHLYIGNTGISDISIVKNMPDLINLDAQYNKISNIETIANLKDLETLDLSHNNIENIEALGDLVYLNKLLINNNKIADINPIYGKDSIDNLNIEGQVIEVSTNNKSFKLPDLYIIVQDSSGVLYSDEGLLTENIEIDNTTNFATIIDTTKEATITIKSGLAKNSVLSIKYMNKNDNDSNEKKDNKDIINNNVEDTNINSDKTKSPNKLPYTGKSKIFLIILVLSIFAILLYKKNIKYKKI